MMQVLHYCKRENCVQSIYPIAWENRTRRGTKNEIDTEGK